MPGFFGFLTTGPTLGGTWTNLLGLKRLHERVDHKFFGLVEIFLPINFFEKVKYFFEKKKKKKSQQVQVVYPAPLQSCCSQQPPVLPQPPVSCQLPPTLLQ
jgi:hypothetical protein